MIYQYVVNISSLYRFGTSNFQQMNELFKQSNELFNIGTFQNLQKGIDRNQNDKINQRQIIGYYRILMEYFPIKTHFNEYISYELLKQTKKFKTDIGRATFYDLRMKMINEPCHQRRTEILGYYNLVMEKLPPLYTQIYRDMQKMAQDMGYLSILDWTQRKHFGDMKYFFHQAEKFLENRKAKFSILRDEFAEKYMNLNRDEFNFADIWRIYGMVDLNNKIQTSIPNSLSNYNKIFNYFYQLKYKLVGQSGLILDVEEREEKNFRAFSGNTMSIDTNPISYQTYLAINPKSSFIDQREIMHETAHVINFLNINSNLAPIFHIAFDPTITEVIAMLFESLYRKPEFLEKYYQIKRVDSELIRDYFEFFSEYLLLNHTLNFISQFQLLVEKSELTDEIFQKSREMYEKRHNEVFGFYRKGADHLSRELDKFFGSYIYSKASICSINLEQCLTKRDPLWFENQNIAFDLRKNYIGHGFSREFDELIQEWGVDPYHFPD